MEDFLDLRIIKTKQTLMNTCFEMLKQKIYSKINIKINKICDKAKINPITFYHHFSNRNDLFSFLIKEKLANKLPIPKKLRPKSLANLINYFINTIINFAFECFEIINNSLNLANIKGRKRYIYWCIFKSN